MADFGVSERPLSGEADIILPENTGELRTCFYRPNTGHWPFNNGYLTGEKSKGIIRPIRAKVHTKLHSEAGFPTQESKLSEDEENGSQSARRSNRDISVRTHVYWKVGQAEDNECSDCSASSCNDVHYCRRFYDQILIRHSAL